MRITIDGQVIEIKACDKDIVDVADRAKVAISAACHHGHQSKRCCRASVVEIDGKQRFACATAPEDGMDVVVDRADMKAMRKGRLLEYREGINSGNPRRCDCSGSIDCSA